MADLCRMILDVDTGIDDAMAILYALHRPGIRLEALTTTFGNTDIDTATTNTLRILELAGRDGNPGRARPRPLVAEAVRQGRRPRPWRATGSARSTLPAPKSARDRRARCPIS